MNEVFHKDMSPIMTGRLFSNGMFLKWSSMLLAPLYNEKWEVRDSSLINMQEDVRTHIRNSCMMSKPYWRERGRIPTAEHTL